MFNPFLATPSAVLFTFGGVSLYWYGVCVALGTAVGVWGWRRALLRLGYEEHQAEQLIVRIVIWGIVGARLYHVLNEIGYYSVYPAEIIALWNGGLAIHGAVIAGGMFLWRHRGKYGLSWLELFASLAPWLAFGQAIGRWGNYFNQELYGSPTNLPWAIPIELARRVAGFESFARFHPIFLYESVGLALIAGLLLLMQKKYSPTIRLGVYGVGIAVLRMLMEWLRIDPVPVIAGVRLPMLISGVILVLGMGCLYYGIKTRNKNFSG